MKTKPQLIKLGLAADKADEVMLLQSKMMEEAVKFQYKKKDGTVRSAVGTLRRDLMRLKDGSLWTPKAEQKPEDASKIDYFDIEAQWWRQFAVANLVSVEG